MWRRRNVLNPSLADLLIIWLEDSEANFYYDEEDEVIRCRSCRHFTAIVADYHAALRLRVKDVHPWIYAAQPDFFDLLKTHHSKHTCYNP